MHKKLIRQLSFALLLAVVNGCGGTIDRPGFKGKEAAACRAGDKSCRDSNQGSTTKGSNSLPGDKALPNGTQSASADQPFPNAPQSFAPRRLWQLTGEQFEKTISSILGRPVQVADKFQRESRPSDGFGTEASKLSMGGSYASTLESVLGEQLKTSDADLSRMLPCGSAAAINAECLKGFITSFGAKAFRRSLTAAEITRYENVYNQVKSNFPSNEALAAVAEAILRSPFTHFRMEVGEALADGATYQLTATELATQIAFAVTNSPPDAPLLAAAASGELNKKEVQEQQIRRLMATPAFIENFTEFMFRYSGIKFLKDSDKNAQSFPEYSPQVADAMILEAKEFLKTAMTTGKGKFPQLMTSGESTITAPLAPIYKIPAFSGSKSYSPAGEERAGFFTLPAVVAANSPANSTGPVQRGIFLLKKLMCTSLPPPPVGTATELPTTDPTATLRERFAVHVSDPSCAGCHTKMDPLGFAMEHYDPIGRFRALDNGKPIDATAVISGTSFSDGSFDNAVDMMASLSKSVDIQACFVRQAFAYSLGRSETVGDAVVLNQAFKRFVDSGLDLNELFLSLYSSDAFRYRRGN